MSREAEKAETRRIIKFLWSRVREHKRWVIWSIFFALGAAVVQIASAAAVKKFLDEALIPRRWDRVLFLCLFVVGLFLFDGLTDFLHRMLLRVAVERTVKRLRSEVFDRLLVFSQSQLAKYDTGRAVNHIVSDSFNVGLGLFIIADVIREPLVLVGLLGYLFYLNWQLTLVCLIAIPLVAVVGKGLGKSARRNQSRYQTSLDHISNHVLQTMGGLKTAHAYGQTGMLRDEFNAKNEKTYHYLIRLARVEELASPLTKWVTSWVGAALIAFGGYLVKVGKMTPGDIFAFVTAAGLLQQPMRQLNNVSVRLQKVIAAGARLYDVIFEPLDALAEAQEAALRKVPAVETIIKPPPMLEYRALGFHYPAAVGGEKRDWAIENISLKLEPGRRLALVGRSGSGKSTLSMLALRFLDPTTGGVYLDGREARSWDLKSYRAQFAFVSQDVFLFHRSIGDNLRFSKPEASDQELWQALEKAHVREFVDGLPGKLDAAIGEHSSTISGGERQRLGIARAFLRGSPILVLDEATSQLDAHSERAVQSALADLMENRSVLVIAHRLSTVREVNEVAVLEGGRLVEFGKPAELLERADGAFANLWRAQQGNKEFASL